MFKIHHDKYGRYRNIRKKEVFIRVLTQEMYDSKLDRFSIGAVEKETKNGWLKLRTYGELQAEKINLAFPNTKRMVKWIDAVNMNSNIS